MTDFPGSVVGGLWGAGYTSIGVPGVVGKADDPVALVHRVSTAPRSPLRTTLYLLPEQSSMPGLDQGPDFQIAGIKVWMDGSPFTGGAAWEEPYSDTRSTADGGDGGHPSDEGRLTTGRS